VTRAEARAEAALYEAAEHLWLGSGKALVAIYHRLGNDDLGGWLNATSWIKVGLVDPDQRPAMARALRRDVEATKPTRNGPKMDRYNAAIAGLATIDKLIAETT
jgi:hypothetical protein